MHNPFVKMGKKEKGFNKKIIMPIFIVAIMVMSVFGYMWGSAKTRLTYNGYKFYGLENNNYMLKLDEKRFVFSYYPSELEGIDADEGIGRLFNTPITYATYDANSTYAEEIAQMQFGLGQILKEAKGIYVQNAFTSETEYGLPAVTCANATSSVPVIFFQKTNFTGLTEEQGCVTASGRNKQEMLMVYERLLYTILGVMG
jgi:hypothetical protein